MILLAAAILTFSLYAKLKQSLSDFCVLLKFIVDKPIPIVKIAEVKI